MLKDNMCFGGILDLGVHCSDQIQTSGNIIRIRAASKFGSGSATLVIFGCICIIFILFGF